LIEKLASRIARFFATKQIYSENEVAAYKYGFELLLSTVFTLVCVLAISIVLRNTWGAVLFFAAFIPLRVTAGGYHANHHWSCMTTMCITFFCFSLTQKLLLPAHVPHFSIAATLVACPIIWKLSPVAATNKPISEAKKNRKREQSLVIASVTIALLIIFIYVPGLPKDWIGYLTSGMLAASLSLVAAAINNKHRQN